MTTAQAGRRRGTASTSSGPPGRYSASTGPPLTAAASPAACSLPGLELAAHSRTPHHAPGQRQAAGPAGEPSARGSRGHPLGRPAGRTAAGGRDRVEAAGSLPVTSGLWGITLPAGFGFLGGLQMQLPIPLRLSEYPRCRLFQFPRHQGLDTPRIAVTCISGPEQAGTTCQGAEASDARSDSSCRSVAISVNVSTPLAAAMRFGDCDEAFLGSGSGACLRARTDAPTYRCRAPLSSCCESDSSRHAADEPLQG